MASSYLKESKNFINYIDHKFTNKYFSLRIYFQYKYYYYRSFLLWLLPTCKSYLITFTTIITIAIIIAISYFSLGTILLYSPYDQSINPITVSKCVWQYVILLKILIVILCNYNKWSKIWWHNCFNYALVQRNIRNF